jgi:hypothetical protein
MALTPFQRDVCRLLAARRRERGESYVAGGVALTTALGTHRISRDIDLFHDTADAVAASYTADRQTLEARGYGLQPIHERTGFVQATVSRAADTLLMEWVYDSAFRFLPLVEHDELGLTLHPIDLATNKVLALVGRLEVRDWIDVLACHERLQPLGYLAWAACGKDPGFTPQSLIGHARRSGRYAGAEISALAFDGPPPDAAMLARTWHAALADADEIIAGLPVVHAGELVLTTQGTLFRGDAAALSAILDRREVLFHAGRIGGALPAIRA